jgi:hypothetical protein
MTKRWKLALLSKSLNSPEVARFCGKGCLEQVVKLEASRTELHHRLAVVGAASGAGVLQGQAQKWI